MMINKYILSLLWICARANSEVAASGSPTDGCRAPTETYNEMDCAECCVRSAGDCQVKSGTSWYHDIKLLDTHECPDTCPPCASCSIRDENSIQSLSPPADCNPNECSTMDIGVDPCFARESCECFCQLANDLLGRCPQISPDWLEVSITEPSTTEDKVDAPTTAAAADSNRATTAPATIVTLAQEGETCDGFSETTGTNYPPCAPGLECQPNPLMMSIPGAGNTCQYAMQTVVWTMEGPWELDTIQSESEQKVLQRIFSQTLGLPPSATMVDVYRKNGIVEIAFTTTASSQLLQPLQDPNFRTLFETQIAQDQQNSDLASEMFITEHDVMAFYVLEGLWEESQIQDFEEQLKLLFSMTLVMDVDQLEEEITTNGKNTQVIYKVKSNMPAEIAPLYDGAAFTEVLRANTKAFPGLSAVLGIADCPVTEPMGGSCVGEMRCEYGTECCCGACSPSFVSVCSNGQWASYYTDACMMGPDNCGQNMMEPATQGLRSTQPDSSDTIGVNASDLVKFAMIGVFFGSCFACVFSHWRSKRNAALQTPPNQYFDISMDSDVARTV